MKFTDSQKNTVLVCLNRLLTLPLSLRYFCGLSFRLQVMVCFGCQEQQHFNCHHQLGVQTLVCLLLIYLQACFLISSWFIKSNRLFKDDQNTTLDIFQLSPWISGLSQWTLFAFGDDCVSRLTLHTNVACHDKSVLVA